MSAPDSLEAASIAALAEQAGRRDARAYEPEMAVWHPEDDAGGGNPIPLACGLSIAAWLVIAGVVAKVMGWW